MFSLPTVMKEAWTEGQKVCARGYYPIEMEVEFASPLLRLYLEEGRTTPMFPSENEIPSLLYIRGEADAACGFEVFIRMKRPINRRDEEK